MSNQQEQWDFGFLVGKHTPGPFAYDSEAGDGGGIVLGGDKAAVFIPGRHEDELAEPSTEWFGERRYEDELPDAWIEKNVVRQFADCHLVADALTALTYDGLRSIRHVGLGAICEWQGELVHNEIVCCFSADNRQELLHKMAEFIREKTQKGAVDDRQLLLF
jgi:hypothetical protein